MLFVGVIRLVPVTTLKIEAAGPATALIPFFFPLRPTLFLTVADIGLQCSSSPQVGNPRTVLCRAHGIRIAHAEAYIFRRIIADVVHHRSANEFSPHRTLLARLPTVYPVERRASSYLI